MPLCQGIGRYEATRHIMRTHPHTYTGLVHSAVIVSSYLTMCFTSFSYHICISVHVLTATAVIIVTNIHTTFFFFFFFFSRAYASSKSVLAPIDGSRRRSHQGFFFFFSPRYGGARRTAMGVYIKERKKMRPTGKLSRYECMRIQTRRTHSHNDLLGN